MKSFIVPIELPFAVQPNVAYIAADERENMVLR